MHRAPNSLGMLCSIESFCMCPIASDISAARHASSLPFTSRDLSCPTPACTHGSCVLCRCHPRHRRVGRSRITRHASSAGCRSHRQRARPLSRQAFSRHRRLQRLQARIHHHRQRNRHTHPAARHRLIHRSHRVPRQRRPRPRNPSPHIIHLLPPHPIPTKPHRPWRPTRPSTQR